ncbi:TetR-like C-terminal domain-containing protein [Mycolicibacterium phlei]
MSSKGVSGQRRRGAALEAAILEAGWDQLIEAGYERFTIEAVAARAQAARSVLYRRWPSRVELLKAVVQHRGEVDRIPVPDTGNLRGDVLALLTEFNKRRSRAVGLLAARLGAYFDEAQGSLRELYDAFVAEGPSAMEAVVQRAIERGELTSVPPPRVVSLPVDLVRHELLMTMAEVPAETIREIVDDVFLPLVRGPRGSAG